MRIVGFLEYGRALEMLDELARRCTAEELEVIDEIIRDREEYTVFPLASHVPPSAQQRPASYEAEEQSDGGGRGLSWVPCWVDLPAIEHPMEPFDPIGTISRSA